MLYDKFVEIAKKQDSRNKFGKCEFVPTFIPLKLQEFYKEHNPIDVEVELNENAIKFYPASEIEQIQKEYDYLNEVFVFATCNGDPIFISKDNTVNTCAHGTTNGKKEFISNNFCEYLSLFK